MIVTMIQYNINIHSYILSYKWFRLNDRKVENFYIFILSNENHCTVNHCQTRFRFIYPVI